MRADLNTKLQVAGRPKVSINDLLIRASALALKEHPLMNVSYVDDQSATMLVHRRVNVGLAVASENGLMVPVITDTDKKTVTQLGAEARQLVGLANAKKLTAEQMSGGTFTVSNLGMFGVEQFMRSSTRRRALSSRSVAPNRKLSSSTATWWRTM